MLAFELATAKNTSLWTVAAAVLLALAAVWLVKEVVKKILTVVILLAIAGLAWSQRTELTDCADRVRDNLAAGAYDDTECTFFGQDVRVPGRNTLVGSDDTTTTTAVPTAVAHRRVCCGACRQETLARKETLGWG